MKRPTTNRYRSESAIVCLALLTSSLFQAGCRENVTSDEPSDEASKQIESEDSLATQIQQVRSGQSDAIILRHKPLCDDDFAKLADLKPLRRLEIEECRVTHVGVQYLTNLPKLEHLKLRGGIGDEELQQLAKISTLRFLNLPLAQFSDIGLAKIGQLSKLELLRFGSPKVSDAGIESLKQIISLRFLHLIDVPITDAALQHISQMKNLESFYLDGSHATDDAIGKLVLARPDLHLHINQQHHDRDPQKHTHKH